jgi:hypothetical protein
MPEIRSMPKTVGFSMPMGEIPNNFVKMAKGIEGVQAKKAKRNKKIQKLQEKRKEIQGKWEDQQQHGKGNEDFDYGDWNQKRDEVKNKVSAMVDSRQWKSGDSMKKPGEQPLRMIRDAKTGRMASNPEYHAFVDAGKKRVGAGIMLREMRGKAYDPATDVPGLAKKHITAVRADIASTANPSVSSTQMNTMTPAPAKTTSSPKTSQSTKTAAPKTTTTTAPKPTTATKPTTGARAPRPTSR